MVCCVQRWSTTTNACINNYEQLVIVNQLRVAYQFGPSNMQSVCIHVLVINGMLRTTLVCIDRRLYH